MKKLLLIIPFLITSTTIQAQVLLSLLFGEKLNSDGLEFGLEGGVSWAQIDKLDADHGLRSSNQKRMTEMPGYASITRTA